MSEAKIIELPEILDERGNLSFIEECRHIPFRIARVYWIYDVPAGGHRDGHAYRRNRELIVALSGSFDVIADGKEKFSLNRPNCGLYVPAGVRRELVNFSTNSLALVIASEPYSEEDYVYEHD